MFIYSYIVGVFGKLLIVREIPIFRYAAFIPPQLFKMLLISYLLKTPSYLNHLAGHAKPFPLALLALLAGLQSLSVGLVGWACKAFPLALLAGHA